MLCSSNRNAAIAATDCPLRDGRSWCPCFARPRPTASKCASRERSGSCQRRSGERYCSRGRVSSRGRWCSSGGAARSATTAATVSRRGSGRECPAWRAGGGRPWGLGCTCCGGVSGRVAFRTGTRRCGRAKSAAGQSTAVASSRTRSDGAASRVTPSTLVAKPPSEFRKRSGMCAQCLNSSSTSVV